MEEEEELGREKIRERVGTRKSPTKLLKEEGEEEEEEKTKPRIPNMNSKELYNYSEPDIQIVYYYNKIL